MSVTHYYTITTTCPRCKSERGVTSYLALRRRGPDGGRCLECVSGVCRFWAAFDDEINIKASRAGMAGPEAQAKIAGLEEVIRMLQQRLAQLEFEKQVGGYRDHFFGEREAGPTFRDGRRTIDLADELRKLMGQFHPDKNPGGLDATKAAQEIGRLYNIVKRSGT